MVDRKTYWRFSLLVIGWIFDIFSLRQYIVRKNCEDPLDGTSNWMEVMGTSLQKSPLLRPRPICCVVVQNDWPQRNKKWNSFQSFFRRFDRWRRPGGYGIVTVRISIGKLDWILLLDLVSVFFYVVDSDIYWAVPKHCKSGWWRLIGFPS